MENKFNGVCTMTFGDRAENHVGMEQIGSLADNGYSLENLEYIKSQIGGEIIELKCEDVDEEDYYIEYETDKKAYLLLIKNGVNKLVSLDKLKEEQFNLKYDKKAYMYGRVVEKHARWNLCFSETGHEADYENKKGTVVAYDDVPITKLLRENINKITGKIGDNLECEANYYYNIEKCGIGFHGDSERKKVIGVRLGLEMPLHFQWFYKGSEVGKRIKFSLEDGDIYVMSEKTVGFDWKKKNITTLRHAAGCNKFLKI